MSAEPAEEPLETEEQNVETENQNAETENENVEAEKENVETEVKNDRDDLAVRRSKIYNDLANTTFVEDHEFDDETIKIHWNIRATTSKPCSCCLKGCGVWFLLTFILVILIAAVNPVEFDIGIPFYDRAEINQAREDAYLAVERDADFVARFNQATSSECIHEAPTLLARNGTLIEGPPPSLNCQRATSQFFRILYISSDRRSNIITLENLEQIRAIEERFLANSELSKYCYLLNTSYLAFETRDVDVWQQTILDAAEEEPITAACERIISPVNFLDELYFDISGDESGLGYYLLPNDQVEPLYNFDQTHLDAVVKYWSQFGFFRSYNLTEFPAAVVTTGDSITVSNLFFQTTASDFIDGANSSVGFTSTYSMGVPLSGYASPSEDADSQYEDVGIWLWEEYDSFLKGAGFRGVDVFFDDSEGQMSGFEEGTLAIESFNLFPVSVGLVAIYLIVMQDSFFIGLIGMMQILLSFIPTIIFYRYIIVEDYIGVLNLISFYIILGVGVDNIFVFTDQYHHHKYEKRLDQRLQKTLNKAGKAMFTTSCTTFISFISNATSVFPAVRAFGTFSALLVAFNFCAVVTFFPTVVAAYHTNIHHMKCDHPLRCCTRSSDDAEEAVEEEDAQEKGDGDEKENAEETGEDESPLVKFFRDTWAPAMIKARYIIVLMFTGLFAAALYGATQLSPDEEAVSSLPEDNVYRQYPEVLLEYFARAGNPRAIQVRWVSGINPDSPIDRSGTDDTDTEDYGVANLVDCDLYNPVTAEAQVWNLLTCQDLFFGNVTQYHGGSEDFLVDGVYGPRERRMLTDQILPDEFFYSQTVFCPAQGLRNWLLTDNGCASLKSYDLECHDVTSQRENCETWDVNGNSCEPYPLPAAQYYDVFADFLLDEDVDPASQLTNFDIYSSLIFVDDSFEQKDVVLEKDFSCRTVDGNVLVGISAVATTDQDFALEYQTGISLFEKWDAWSEQMRANAPREMLATMQVSNGAWAYYYLNETLIIETFSSIFLALGLSFVVLTLIGGNAITAAISVFNICLIVTDVFAFTVIVGWRLGVIEAVNYVVVIGLSIDYSVHMSEAFSSSKKETRFEKVEEMLEEVGVSVLSGAVSTLLAAFPMFFAPNSFFVKFATFLFVTIFLSCVYALVFFPAFLAIIGPLGHYGQIYYRLHQLREYLVHEFAKRHVQSKVFLEKMEKEAAEREGREVAQS